MLEALNRTVGLLTQATINGAGVVALRLERTLDRRDHSRASIGLTENLTPFRFLLRDRHATIKSAELGWDRDCLCRRRRDHLRDLNGLKASRDLTTHGTWRCINHTACDLLGHRWDDALRCGRWRFHHATRDRFGHSRDATFLGRGRCLHNTTRLHFRHSRDHALLRRGRSANHTTCHRFGDGRDHTLLRLGRSAHHATRDRFGHSRDHTLLRGRWRTNHTTFHRLGNSRDRALCGACRSFQNLT